MHAHDRVVAARCILQDFAFQKIYALNGEASEGKLRPIRKEPGVESNSTHLMDRKWLICGLKISWGLARLGVTLIHVKAYALALTKLSGEHS